VKPTPNVEYVTNVVYGFMLSAFGQDDARHPMLLRDGGVLLTAPDGDHVQVYVTSVHFEPGEAVPF
jgi:hypothetical protein